MGMFDTIHEGHRCGQVKLFGSVLDDYVIGDRVSNPNLPDSFQVAMELGYIFVENSILTSWDSMRRDVPLFDSYGNPISKEEDANRLALLKTELDRAHAASSSGDESAEYKLTMILNLPGSCGICAHLRHEL